MIQHVQAEEPFAVAGALAGAGVDVAVRRTFAAEALPHDLSGVAGLVVMGGPMSAARDDDFATRRAELHLLAAAVEAGLPTLGICLGAQLLALAAGGRVVPGPAGLEVGWGPVDLTGAAATDPLFAGIDGPVPVLHWHGETYERPTRAFRLASSAAYPEQAFRVGDRAWGLQFHVEVDEAVVAAFADAFPADLAAVGSSAPRLLAATPAALARLAAPRALVLGRFAALVAGGPAGSGHPPGARAASLP